MTLPFTRPLLVTEHVEFDRMAEAVGLEMARRSGQQLDAVLPLVDNPEFALAAPELAEQADAEAAAKAEAFEAMARVAGVPVALQVRRAPERSQAVLAVADELAADLIVIRRRGQRALLSRLLVGEMGAKVLAHARCSVLVVPRVGGWWKRAVLLGLEAEAAEPGLVPCAAQLARAEGLPLHVVAVAPRASARAVAQAAVDAALGQARALGAEAHGRVRVGALPAELIAAAAELQADLIVLPRHCELRGAAEKLIGHAGCSVLAHVPHAAAP